MHWFRSRTQLTAASLGVLALLLSACGGTTSTPTPPPTAPPPTQPTATPGQAPGTPRALPTPIPTATPTPARQVAPTPTPSAQGKERFGGNLRYWQSNGPNTGTSGGDPLQNLKLGPADFYASAQIRENVLIYSPYVQPRNTVLVGQLAEKWEYSSDLKNLTFKIRPGVTWTDGRLFTAKDVEFTYNNVLNPPTGWNSPLTGSMKPVVDKITATDDATVVFSLKAPSVSFIAQLAIRASGVWPAHIPLEDSYSTAKMIGTGPFTVKEFKSEVSLSYQRNPKYWMKDEFGNQLPYLDSMTMYFITDPNAIFAAVIAGQLDSIQTAAFVLRGREAELRKALPGVKIFGRLGGNIGLSMQNTPPFNDKRVRQALDLSFDRLTHAVLSSEGVGWIDFLGVMPHSSGGVWGYDTKQILSMPGRRYVDKATGQLETDQAKLLANPNNYKKDPADIQKAKDLLKAAGFNGFPVDTMMAHTQWLPGAEAAANSWERDLGTKIKLEVLDPATFAARQAARKYQLAAFPLGSGTPDDPTLPLIINYDCTRMCHGFPLDDLKALVNQEDQTLDPAKRNEVVFKIQDLLLDQAYFLFGYNAFGSNDLNVAKVQNFPQPAVSQSPTYRLEQVWILKG